MTGALSAQEMSAKIQELEKALKYERDLNALQRQFVTLVGHEFRTPLAIIDGFAQRMSRQAQRDKLTTEDTLLKTQSIRNTVQRMVRLIDSTLAAAAIEEGKTTLKLAQCDIGELVAKACEYHQSISEDHVISCALENVPESIHGDVDFLELMITNLLSNAVKYAPHAPDIEVVVRGDGDEVIVSVRDKGVGIDAVDLAKIGERFFRAKTSHGMTGTGIGLNVVKMMVDEHQGSLSVESTKGVGSLFTVRLPIAGPETSAIER